MWNLTPTRQIKKKKESPKVIDTENRWMFAKGIVGRNKMGEGESKGTNFQL